GNLVSMICQRGNRHGNLTLWSQIIHLALDVMVLEPGSQVVPEQPHQIDGEQFTAALKMASNIKSFDAGLNLFVYALQRAAIAIPAEVKILDGGGQRRYHCGRRFFSESADHARE